VFLIKRTAVFETVLEMRRFRYLVFFAVFYWTQAPAQVPDSPYSAPCPERVLAATINLATIESPTRVVLLKHVQRLLNSRGQRVHNRVLKDLESATPFLSNRQAYAEVRISHTLIHFVAGALVSEERLWFFLEFFFGIRGLPDGLGFPLYLRSHPLGEVVLIHELSHLMRAYSWIGKQSNWRVFHQNFSPRGILWEEGKAYGDEYLFLVDAYAGSDLGLDEEVRANGDKEDLPVLVEGSPEHLEELDRDFRCHIKKALTSSQSQYVDWKLKKFAVKKQEDRKADLPAWMRNLPW